MTQEYAINMPMTILGPVEQVTAKSSPGAVGYLFDDKWP